MYSSLIKKANYSRYLEQLRDYLSSYRPSTWRDDEGIGFLAKYFDFLKKRIDDPLVQSYVFNHLKMSEKTFLVNWAIVEDNKVEVSFKRFGVEQVKLDSQDLLLESPSFKLNWSPRGVDAAYLAYGTSEADAVIEHLDALTWLKTITLSNQNLDYIEAQAVRLLDKMEILTPWEEEIKQEIAEELDAEYPRKRFRHTSYDDYDDYGNSHSRSEAINDLYEEYATNEGQIRTFIGVYLRKPRPLDE